jgi:hypothetical protein
MRPREIRHYCGEEILMHMLGDESPELGKTMDSHLSECSECGAIYREYRELLKDIHGWSVEEISEAAWEAQKDRLLALVRYDDRGVYGNLWAFLISALAQAWDYALTHPLPTLGYVAVSVAFALERTVSVFRMDQMLPATGEVLQILRQIL